LGDEGGLNDNQNNSQRITNDFFSAILRIDVDKRPGSLTPGTHPAATTNYAVPPDNPFVGATHFNGLTVNSNKVRTEFWAVGLRNPWRMSFDPETDVLYCGDVGESAREEIDLIVGGGNYGWAYMEGNLTGPKYAQAPPGFIHTRPLLDYPRSQGFAVTGGLVYRGQRFAQLYGAYVYGDYGTGKIWALRHSGTNVTENTLLLTDDLNSINTAGISAFGMNPANDDLLYADEQNGSNGRIKRLLYNNTTNGAPLPPTLADTGAFADLTTLTPEAGIVPYDVNVPFWSDNAHKSRWFSVPDTNLVIGFEPDANWSFPTGTVWIKHFELELTNGLPASRKRLETRFLIKNAAGVYGLTYRWDESVTNATLVPEEGMDEEFVIDDGGGILRTQTWHYPSRVECLECHTAAAGYGLGFNTGQLNRDINHDATITNQIAALCLAGYFNTNVTETETLRKLASATNDSFSLEYRVRSYLAANCAQCHQPGGPAHDALWDARITTPTEDAGIVFGPLANDTENSGQYIIAPNSLTNSMLLTRIAKRGPGQMPPLASSVLDTQAIALVSGWITNGWPTNPCVGVLNPGFEDGFNLAGMGYIATNWTAWETDPGVVSGYADTAITHEGAHAQGIGVWGDANGSSGGVYQRVPIALGQRFDIMVWVQAEDGLTACSLGVDPAGGTNANEAVTWSPASTNTAWEQLSLTGVAQGNYLTVFYKVATTDNGQHNGYFDDATPPAVTDRPKLLAQPTGNGLTLTWPQCPNAHLEQAHTLSSPISWTTVTNQVVISGGQNLVTLVPAGSVCFYRLVLE